MPPIRPEFQAHQLNDHGKQLANAVSEICSDALTKLEGFIGPPSRERSLAITKLQEVAFWARRAVAIQPTNQVGAPLPSKPGDHKGG